MTTDVLPFVLFRLPDGRRQRVPPGGLIGRTAAAALQIDAPEISEAHALVSLRGHSLVLLRLRGGLRHRDAPVKRLELQQGQRIAVAPGVEIVVEAVALPAAVWVVSAAGPGGDVGPISLVESRYSVFQEERPRVVTGVLPGAAAHLWATDGAWRVRWQGDLPQAAGPGWTDARKGLQLQLQRTSLAEVGVDNTVRDRSPLDIEWAFDAVTISREGLDPVQLTGLDARIVSVLCETRQPMAWQEVMREAWGRGRYAGLKDPRKSWDNRIGPLRRRLRAAWIREPFLLSDGCGNIDLCLFPGDAIRERGVEEDP